MAPRKKAGKKKSAALAKPVSNPLLELAGDVDLEAAEAAADDARSAEREDLQQDAGRPRITLNNVHLSVGQETFTAALVAHHRSNAFWKSAKPTPGARPDCLSLDGITGKGDNGKGDGSRKCRSCPMNEFNSDMKGGKGKACKNTRVLFLHRLDPREENTAPIEVLQVAPTSMKSCSAYLQEFLNDEEHFFSHETIITAVDPPTGHWQFQRGKELSEEMGKVMLALNYKHRTEYEDMMSSQGDDEIVDAEVVD